MHSKPPAGTPSCARSMVSPQLGRALYELAQQPKRFVQVQGAVHEDTSLLGQAQYRQALQELFGLGKTRE